MAAKQVARWVSGQQRFDPTEGHAARPKQLGWATTFRLATALHDLQIYERDHH